MIKLCVDVALNQAEPELNNVLSASFKCDVICENPSHVAKGETVK